MILRLLNWQGIAGIAVGLGLSIMLLIQKGETAHWKKQSAGFEHLYRQDQSAFATTVANARAAAEQARAADRANADRVASEQAAINERTKNDFEARLAAARSAASRLSSGGLQQRSEAATDSGSGRSASVPRVPAAAGRAAEIADQDGLPATDALIATEQAIQLDELIKWIRKQAAVDNNPKGDASPPGD